MHVTIMCPLLQLFRMQMILCGQILFLVNNDAYVHVDPNNFGGGWIYVTVYGAGRYSYDNYCHFGYITSPPYIP